MSEKEITNPPMVETPIDLPADVLEHIVGFLRSEERVCLSWTCSSARRAIPCLPRAFEIEFVTSSPELVRFALSRGLDSARIRCRDIAERGDVAMLEHVHEVLGLPLDVQCALVAADARTLHWLLDRGCPTRDEWVNEDSISAYAVSDGRMDVLRACRQRGLEWSEEVFYQAVRRRDADAIRYLADEGCPVDDWATVEAARAGDAAIAALVRRVLDARGVPALFEISE